MTWSAAGRARHGGHRRGHTKTSRQSLRTQGSRGQEPQGHRWAGAGLGGAAGEFSGRPLRGTAHDRRDRAGWAGRRTRITASALVEGEDRRRPGGAALRRGRYRQIAAHSRAAGTPRHRTAHAVALFLFAATHRQRVPPDHRPDGTRRRTGVRRQTASEAQQARCGWRHAEPGGAPRPDLPVANSVANDPEPSLDFASHNTKKRSFATCQRRHEVVTTTHLSSLI